MVVVYFNSKLMFLNLYGGKALYRRYGEQMMTVSVKDLQTNIVHISNDV